MQVMFRLSSLKTITHWKNYDFYKSPAKRSPRLARELEKDVEKAVDQHASGLGPGHQQFVAEAGEDIATLR